MHLLKVSITRFIDESQPGFVECTFRDAQGEIHAVIEKVPVVSEKDLWRDSTYPTEGQIGCTLLEKFDGGEGELVARIDTELPWHIESVEGRTIFVVPASSLIEYET